MLLVTMNTYLATGIVTSEMLPMFAIVLPAMVVPILLGTLFYKRINDATFRKIGLALLTGSGTALLISSVPQLVERFV